MIYRLAVYDTAGALQGYEYYRARPDCRSAMRRLRDTGARGEIVDTFKAPIRTQIDALELLRRWATKG